MSRISLAFFFAALLFAHAAHASAQERALPPKLSQKPLNTPGEDFDFRPRLSNGRFSVVTFYADWCPACRSWSPVLDAVNRHFPDMQVLFMDIEDWGSLVAEKYEVEAIPYFMIYDQSGRLFARGREAQAWLRAALQARVNAARQGTYDLEGLTGGVNVGAASDSVTARAARGRQVVSGLRGRRAATRAVTPAPPRPATLDTAEPLPSSDDVLGRYVEAIGGGQAIAKQLSRSIRGKVEVPSLGTGKFEVHSKAPNKALTVADVTQHGPVRQWFDGSAGWTQTGRAPARRLAGAELSALRRDADFYAPLRLKLNYPRMKVLGVTRIGYRVAYVIEAAPAAGAAELLYFSKESGLMIRRDVVRPTPRGEVTAEVYLDDWREVDGIKLPFRVTESLPGLTLTFTLEEVRHGDAISDSLFVRPGAR